MSANTATMFDDDYLLLSGIQHFVFCRRQWALIHVEQQWADNLLTAQGESMHVRTHDSSQNEKRGDLIITRGMLVFSHTMRIRGVCDVVEFRRDAGGITLFGRKGLWLPCPVEYKRGRPKTHEADKMQLCAQAMCLEEMLLCPPIETAYLYYGETKRRETVILDEDLRAKVCAAFAQMHKDFNRRHTPRVKPTKACSNCSLLDICLPKMPKETAVAEYIQNVLAEDETSCESF